MIKMVEINHNSITMQPRKEVKLNDTIRYNANRNLTIRKPIS